MIFAEMPLSSLQSELNVLAALHEATPGEAPMGAFLMGAIAAIAWMGGGEVPPSVRARIFMEEPEVMQ